MAVLDLFDLNGSSAAMSPVKSRHDFWLAIASDVK
jgi:hypothetical protein